MSCVAIVRRVSTSPVVKRQSRNRTMPLGRQQRNMMLWDPLSHPFSTSSQSQPSCLSNVEAHYGTRQEAAKAERKRRGEERVKQNLEKGSQEKEEAKKKRAEAHRLKLEADQVKSKRRAEERPKQNLEPQLKGNERAEERPTQNLELQLNRQKKNKKISRWEAARAIPSILMMNETSLERTMVALDLRHQSDDISDDNAGVLAEYRQMYIDSIPSFIHLLQLDSAQVSAFYEKLNPSTNHTNMQLWTEGESNSPEGGPARTKIEALLDDLAEAGFADSQFRKHHDRMGKYLADHDQHESLLRRKKRQYQRRFQAHRNATEILTQMEQRYNLENDRTSPDEPPKELSKPAQQSAPSNDTHTGIDDHPIPIINRTMQLLSNIFSLPSTKNDEEPILAPPSTKNEEESLDQKDANETKNMSYGHKRITHQRKLVKEAERALKSAINSIKLIVAHREAFRPPISMEEYKATYVVLDELCPAFAFHVEQRHSQMIVRYRLLDAKTDLTKPHEWYPYARMDRRKIIYHGGPTNSGKTYAALQRLKEANKGLYLGPLRLLASEIYETLSWDGVYTNLFTGQEKRVIPFATHSAATVEMTMMQEEYEVVVIDEIQMIADHHRGYAWSRALLGSRCKEIHVCGGMEAVPLIQKIAKSCGDEFELHTYSRFTDLTVAETSFASAPDQVRSYKSVQPGDCVVAFSRNDIFAIKREIEQSTQYKCCIIYGALPPSTRADQAKKFNNQNSGYDILVASDAIGMGLNLSIKRIIFNSIYKSNGEKIIRLDHSAVKQISGRAGRKNSPFPSGEVTCRDPRDLEYVKSCMHTEIKSVEKAGLLPTASHIEVFSDAVQSQITGQEELNMHKILSQFVEMATIKGDYFMCRQGSMKVIARFLKDLPLNQTDMYNFCMCPVNVNCKRSMNTLRKFAEKHAVGEASGMRRSMIPKPAKTYEDIQKLCALHAELELFIWLQNKFPGNIVEMQTAISIQEQTIAYINQGIPDSDNMKVNHCYIKRDKHLREIYKKEKSSKGSNKDDIILDIMEEDQFDDILPHIEVDEI
eukprot:scaffold40295_cov46-Attheya_sp.AAC.5